MNDKILGAHYSNSEEWSCKRKIRFNGRKKAENYIKTIKKNGRFFDRNPAIYKCKFCGGWHLGHRRKQ